MSNESHLKSGHEPMFIKDKCRNGHELTSNIVHAAKKVMFLFWNSWVKHVPTYIPIRTCIYDIWYKPGLFMADTCSMVILSNNKKLFTE